MSFDTFSYSPKLVFALKKVNLILNYHRVLSLNDEPNSDLNGIYSIDFSAFKWQIDFLIRNNIPVVSIADLSQPELLPAFSVCFSFDDGNRSDFELVCPFLKERNIPATFFIPVNSCELNWNELSEMSRLGFEIGSHGFNHSMLSKNALPELAKSKRVLEEMLNIPIQTFAFPYGVYSKKNISAAFDCGYKTVFSTDKKVNYPVQKSPLLHRWSIKGNMTKTDFEQLVLSETYRNRKQMTSALVRSGKKLVGKRMADRLNLFINS